MTCLLLIRHLWPSVNSSTWYGAGSVDAGTGAGGVSGAAGLTLVEGPFQLPPPLDPAVLLTEVLEDLLCGHRDKNSLKPGHRTLKNGDSHLHCKGARQEVNRYNPN